MDTLAVRLTVPPVGPVEDFHLHVGAPCRAHHKKTGRLSRQPGYLILIFQRPVAFRPRLAAGLAFLLGLEYMRLLSQMSTKIFEAMLKDAKGLLRPTPQGNQSSSTFECEPLRSPR